MADPKSRAQAYRDLEESMRKRRESGAQARDVEKMRKEQEEERKRREAEQRKKDDEQRKNDESPVERGLRRWINPDTYRRGGAASQLVPKAKGGVRG